MNLLDLARRTLAGRPASPPGPAAAQTRGNEVNEENEQSPPPWDQAGADRALAEVNARFDAVVAGATVNPARRKVTEVYRGLARDYHARRDPLLFEVGAALDGKGWGA